MGAMNTARQPQINNREEVMYLSHPHTEPPDVCREIVAWEILESYAKKVIKNKGRSLHRSLYRRFRREIAKENPAQYETHVDRYPSEDYNLRVDDNVYSIHNRLVYRALKQLSHKKLSALILYYWELWSDDQIGSQYGVSDRTIRAWRRQSFDQIREFVKGESENESENQT